MLLKLKLLSLSGLVLLTACSSSEVETTSIGDIPSWILAPEVDDGIAVAECVIFSGNFSIDQSHAKANARSSLAQRIETRVSAMDKVYRDKIEVSSGVESGSTFSSVSKQVTQKTLVGASVLKTDIVELAGQDNLCIMLGMGQESTKEIFDSLVDASNRPMSASQKDVLYAEFKADRAEKQLDLELEKLQ